ncbi:histone-lysine N-methyltransferase SETD1B-like [Eurosta solidaginis]|uniref:histone-lysine N-methyltransferase SETD1B-like n=1 Tax=Eurosta solidaginis TaxID=178769 RepID=UPI003530FB87
MSGLSMNPLKEPAPTTPQPITPYTNSNLPRAPQNNANQQDALPLSKCHYNTLCNCHLVAMSNTILQVCHPHLLDQGRNDTTSSHAKVYTTTATKTSTGLCNATTAAATTSIVGYPSMLQQPGYPPQPGGYPPQPQQPGYPLQQPGAPGGYIGQIMTPTQTGQAPMPSRPPMPGQPPIPGRPGYNQPPAPGTGMYQQPQKKDKETLITTFKAIGQPIACYASPIWSPSLKTTHWKKLQACQNTALRTATGCLLMSPEHHLHNEARNLGIPADICLMSQHRPGA